jgi:hypothetical protein
LAGTPSKAVPAAELRDQYGPCFGANTVIYNDSGRKWNAFGKAPYDLRGFYFLFSTPFSNQSDQLIIFIYSAIHQSRQRPLAA